MSQFLMNQVWNGSIASLDVIAKTCHDTEAECSNNWCVCVCLRGCV
jgi:hypothetical protein